MTEWWVHIFNTSWRHRCKNITCKWSVSFHFNSIIYKKKMMWLVGIGLDSLMQACKLKMVDKARYYIASEISMFTSSETLLSSMQANAVLPYHWLFQSLPQKQLISWIRAISADTISLRGWTLLNSNIALCVKPIFLVKVITIWLKLPSQVAENYLRRVYYSQSWNFLLSHRNLRLEK